MDTDLGFTNGTKTIAAFVIVAYAMSVALSLIVGLTGGYQSPLIGLQLLSMFIPALAVLAVRPLPGGTLTLDWHRLSWTYLPVEIGWRAWLLPRLQTRVGPRRAVIITSAVWAAWHVPFQLSGVQHIDGVAPVILALTLPIGPFGAGLVIGWLWLRTESIWIVSLAHGAFNNWGQYAFKYMQFVQAPGMVVVGAGSLAVVVVGVLLLT
ncbi:MAG: lysostaphin resistance A-like protein, partial [Vicinamibacterales bacterium]